MIFGSNNLTNRQNWVEKTLKAIPINKKIIDVGAGECQYKIHCDHLDYISQDFNQYSGVGNGVGYQTGEWDISEIDIISDILEIPVDDKSFDAVLCTEVLEHVPNPIAAIEEMSRLLNKNGQLILTAPFCSLTHFAPYHYCDGFSKYFYEYHLGRLGFEDIEIIPNGNYYQYIAQEMERLPTIFKMFSSKSSLFLKIISRIMIKVLEHYNNRCSNTDSMLCFGYHVKATKK